MANAATVDVICGRNHGLQRLRHHDRMTTRRPLFKRRRVGKTGMTRGMTPAANGGGQFNSGTHRRVVLGCRVPGGGTMTIFTLHPGELRCGRGADKSRGQTVTNRMTRQTCRIILAARRLKFRVGKSRRMRRIGLKTAHARMTGDAYFGTGIFGSRPGYPEKRIAVKFRDRSRTYQIGSFAPRQPRRIQTVTLLEDLIVARRPIPGELNAIGRCRNASHDRQARYSSWLDNGLVQYCLPRHGPPASSNAYQHQDNNDLGDQ